MRRRRARPVYVFHAKLAGLTGVKCRVAVRSDQTLADLHEALGKAFGWEDDRLYAFWLDGRFWSLDAVEYGHPDHARSQNPRGTLWELPETRSAETALDCLALAPGQKLAHVFDFDDEWRVELTIEGITADDGATYPAVVEAIGKTASHYPGGRRAEDAA